jgi:hypothetical protein
MKNKPLSIESRILILDNCNGCIISNDTPCEMGLTASHFFKSNTMKGNPFWDYSNPNNAVCMCSKHHDQYEKLNADDRILYIQNYSKVPFTGKIISRMKALLKRKKPLAIYPKVKSKKQVGRMMTNIILKEFMPDEMF